MPPVVAEAGSTTAEIPCDASGQTLLTVTKTYTDTHTGKMSLCKVLSGTLTPDTGWINSRTRDEERLHALGTLSGHTTTPTTSVAAGDFVAIPRLNGTRTGDTLAPKGQPVSIPLPDVGLLRHCRWPSSQPLGPTTTSSCLPCNVSATRISPSP